jgi:hypothetical protein
VGISKLTFMNIERCGFCGFKENTKEAYACQACEHDPWWSFMPYPTSPHSSALEEFKAILDFETKQKNKTQAHDEYDFN